LQEIKKRNLDDEIVVIKQIIKVVPIPVIETLKGTVKQLIDKQCFGIRKEALKILHVARRLFDKKTCKNAQRCEAQKHN
jgi:hypothetical protein